MQINLNPTSERGASRDAVNRPRETLGDSHLISSDPRSHSGWYVTFFVARVIRTTEQPNSEAVCVEVHSTRLAELAKACGAALLSSFRCQTPKARITTTLFEERST